MRFASREFASRESQVKIIYTDSGWSLEMSVCYLRAPYRRSSLRPSNDIVTLQCQLWLPLEVQSSRCCFENNLTVRFSLRSHFAGHREHRRSYLVDSIYEARMMVFTKSEMTVCAINHRRFVWFVRRMFAHIVIIGHRRILHSNALEN